MKIPKGRALMQMYTVVPKAKRGNAIVHPVNALL